LGQPIKGQFEVDASIYDIGPIGTQLSMHPDRIGEITKNRIGIPIIMADLDKGKTCCEGKGVRTWVVMVYPTIAGRNPPSPLRNGNDDWTYTNTKSTNDQDFVDFASGRYARSSQDDEFEAQYILGIACRSKKDNKLFQKQLLAVALYVLGYTWTRRPGVDETATAFIKPDVWWFGNPKIEPTPD